MRSRSGTSAPAEKRSRRLHPGQVTAKEDGTVGWGWLVDMSNLAVLHRGTVCRFYQHRRRLARPGGF
jgi:hypothetical protein